MWKTRPIATIVLAVMVAIFLGTYPFRDNVYMGFLWHLSGAAMIGGLADWYAVKALFGKPLGISYKTNVIPRSRDKIIAMAHHMVMKELLTTNHIYGIAKRYKLVESFLVYFLSPAGRAWFHDMRLQLGEKTSQSFDLQVLFEEIKNIAKKGLHTYQVAPLLLSFGYKMVEPATWDVLWKYIIRMLKEFIASPSLTPYLTVLVDQIMNRYKETSTWRTIALSFVDTEAQVEQIVQELRKRSLLYLEELEHPNSSLSHWAQQKVDGLLQELGTNEAWKATIEQVKMDWLEKLMIQTNVSGDALFQSVLERGEKEVIAYLEGALAEEEKRVPLERAFLYQLRQALAQIRPRMEEILLQELESYSPERMSELVESKVYYDLQMVRINGSLVGGVLGGAFYILHLLAGGGL